MMKPAQKEFGVLPTMIGWTLLFAIMALGMWQFRPGQDIDRQLPMPIEPPPVPTVVSPMENPATNPLTKVNLLQEVEISDSAAEEMSKGRFLLKTLILDGRNKEEIYRQLLLREGIVVALDGQGVHHWLGSQDERISLAKMAAKLDLERFALHRPRSVDPREVRHLRRSVLPGDEVFLVMPNDFEATSLTEIEARLPAPLSEFAEATLRLSVSQGGHLDFLLVSAAANDGTIHPIGESFRGP